MFNIFFKVLVLVVYSKHHFSNQNLINNLDFERINTVKKIITFFSFFDEINRIMISIYLLWSGILYSSNSIKVFITSAIYIYIGIKN